jgi:enoyl-CoA hydratase/carnithine racemase
MDYEQITYEKRGNAGLITLNRPDRLNAWTYKMSGEMVDAIDGADADPEIGAIVVTGAGRGFCAGADVRDSFLAGQQARDEGRQVDRGMTRNWVEVVRAAKPMIAAVNGVSVGVGLTMIAPFDIIIASDRAQFGMFFIRVGLVPELASTYFLSQRMGLGHASEMCLTGRLYSGEEAAKTGLANRVVPHDSLMDEALAMANLLASNPGPQLGFIKDLITRNATVEDYHEAMNREHKRIEDCYSTPEHREAIAAFLEKRQPKFR